MTIGPRMEMRQGQSLVMTPAMQQAIKWDLKAQDGTPIAQETQHTVHVVPGIASVN